MKIWEKNESCLLLVQPAGFFCFEGEESKEIEETRKLKYFLPLSEELMIFEKNKSQEARGRKMQLQYNKKSQLEDMIYSITFESKEEMSGFISVVKRQQACNTMKRQEINAKQARSLGVNLPNE